MPDSESSLTSRAASLVQVIGQYDVVREASWKSGSLLHHKVPRLVNRTRSKFSRNTGVSGNPSSAHSHAETESDPLELRPATGVENPVLTACDVTDFGRADGVADPFILIDEDGQWHMFMEVYNRGRSPTAAIGHATSPDGDTWEYDAIVLEGEVHLSFPYVFEWNGTNYMIPDSWDRRADCGSATLYEARKFPETWTPVSTLVTEDRPIHDVVVFRWRDAWWAIGGDERDLYAYHSSRLRADDWVPHAENPVVTDRPRAARPAGRPLGRNDYILAPFQDCARQYGDKVRAFKITDLTPTSYDDVEVASSPLLGESGTSLGWNSGKMHHVDARYDGGKWRCAVDGNIGLGKAIFGTNWAIGMYESREQATTPSGAEGKPALTCVHTCDIYADTRRSLR